MASAIGMVQTAQRLGPALGPGHRRRARAERSACARAFLVSVGVLRRRPGAGDGAVSRRAGDARSADSAQTAAGARHVQQRARLRAFVLLMGVIFAMQFVDRSLARYCRSTSSAAWASRPSRVPIVSGMLFSMRGRDGVASAITSAGRCSTRHSPRAIIAGGVGSPALRAADVACRPRRARRLAIDVRRGRRHRHDRGVRDGRRRDSRERARDRFRVSDQRVAAGARAEPDGERLRRRRAASGAVFAIDAVAARRRRRSSSVVRMDPRATSAPCRAEPRGATGGRRQRRHGAQTVPVRSLRRAPAANEGRGETQRKSRVRTFLTSR